MEMNDFVCDDSNGFDVDGFLDSMKSLDQGLDGDPPITGFVVSRSLFEKLKSHALLTEKQKLICKDALFCGLNILVSDLIPSDRAIPIRKHQVNWDKVFGAFDSDIAVQPLRIGK